MNTQVHVIYTGRVQGVGFRYTVREIAQRMRVTGTVRNVPDGSVELNAQADEQVLRGFLDAVHAHFSRYIRDTSVAWLPVNAGFEDFEIIF